jgi:hypothetical protein
MFNVNGIRVLFAALIVAGAGPLAWANSDQIGIYNTKYGLCPTQG